MCGAIDLRELAPPSVGKGAADRVVTLRREAAAFLPAASFELRAPDRATVCAWAKVGFAFADRRHFAGALVPSWNKVLAHFNFNLTHMLCMCVCVGGCVLRSCYKNRINVKLVVCVNRESLYQNSFTGGPAARHRPAR